MLIFIRVGIVFLAREKMSLIQKIEIRHDSSCQNSRNWRDRKCRPKWRSSFCRASCRILAVRKWLIGVVQGIETKARRFLRFDVQRRLQTSERLLGLLPGLGSWLVGAFPATIQRTMIADCDRGCQLRALYPTVKLLDPTVREQPQPFRNRQVIGSVRSPARFLQ